MHEPGLVVELLGKDGCNMVEDTCLGSEWVSRVRALRPEVSLIYVAGVFLYGFHVKGDWHTACRPDWDGKLERVLTARFRELSAERGRVFTATVPYPVGPYETDRKDRLEFHERVDCINAVIRKAVLAAPGVRLIDVATRLCPGGICEQDIGASEPVRPDGVHFSIVASRGIARWVYDEIQH